MVNDGANEGFWRFQIRDKYGRWVQMGGAVTFTTDHPNFGRISGTGLFEGGSRPDYAMIRVKNHATLEDGVYEVAAGDMEAVKAIIPENAPGLVEAKELDAADGISANPLAPVTLESLPEATPSAAGQNAYYVEFEGTELNSEEAERGVHMYVGQGYKLINKILRDNPEGSVEEFIATSNSESYLAEATGVGFDGEFAATAGSKIADLDYAISSTNLKNDTTLYRGMTANPDRYQDLLNMEPGDEFQDFGFVSTSTLEKSAMKFTSTSVQGKEQGRLPILFRINAQGGSNAMRTYGGMNGESEVVLPRGTKVEIVSKSQRDGVLIIDAKVVSTKPETAVPEAPAIPEVVPTAKQNNEELTEEQLESLEWYTDTGFEVVANKLRKGLEVPDYYQAEIDTLIDLVSSKQTTQERVIYRGKATTDPVRAGELNNLEVGDVLFDPGIASYSPDENTADWFAKLSGDNPKVGARAVFVVDLPAGSTAFDIPREINPKEPEVLLPPNTSIEVTGIEERAGIRYISAKIVPNAEPAAPAEESGVKDLTGFTQLSTQKGFNPGGLYQDPETGEKFYVKFEDAIRVDNEVLASRLYEKTGINAIKVEKGSMDGKTISYSKWEDGATADLLAKLENDSDMAQKLKEGFAVDAWLANWDVVGLVYDNLIFDAEGNDLRVDPGGALLYRAQGARKGDAFGDVVGELETFQEGGKTTSRIYGNMTQLDRVMSARKLLDISDADIDEMVDATISDAADNELLKTRLKNRRSYILTTYGLDGKTPAKPSEETSADEAVVSGWAETSPGVQGLEESAIFDQILTEDTLRYGLLTSPLPEVDAGVFSDAQRSAIDGYTGPEYSYVNGLLRTGKVEDKFKDFIESRISDLDSAMDSAGVLEAPARVFRGIKGWKPGTTFYSGVDWAQEMENLKVGDVFSDDGYMSTTEDPRVAYEEFGGGEREGAADGTSGVANNAIEQTNATVFFSIDLPAGSKALKLPKEFVYQNQQDEQEVLLPRGTKLKVKAIRRVRQDRGDLEAYNYFVDAEAVPQDEVGVIDVVSETAEDRGAVVRPEPVSMIDANGYEIPPGEQILHNFSTLSGEDFEASFTYTGYNGRMFGASEKEAAENLIIVESEGNPYIDDGFYFIESRFANMVLDLDENGEVSDEQSKMWDEDLANLDPQAFVEFRKMADPETLTFIESASDAAAIKTYTLPESFTAVAKLLRSEKSLETLEDEADIKNADVIKTLDSIIERSPDLAVGSTLYRGVKRSDRSIMKALRDSIIDGSITEISDTSFGSTSESQYVASNFAGMPRSENGESLTTVFRIKVTTPGRKGLRIPPFLSIISEQEVILPRGSTYKVVGHEVAKGGTLFVDLEY